MRSIATAPAAASESTSTGYCLASFTCQDGSHTKATLVSALVFVFVMQLPGFRAHHVRIALVCELKCARSSSYAIIKRRYASVLILRAKIYLYVPVFY